MARIRQIKKWAGLWGIRLKPSDIEDLKLKENDETDIDDLKIIKKTGKKQ